MRIGKGKRNTWRPLPPGHVVRNETHTFPPATEGVHLAPLFIRGMLSPQFINWLIMYGHAHSCKYKS
jgi:hypothetical protein